MPALTQNPLMLPVLALTVCATASGCQGREAKDAGDGSDASSGGEGMFDEGTGGDALGGAMGTGSQTGADGGTNSGGANNGGGGGGGGANETGGQTGSGGSAGSGGEQNGTGGGGGTTHGASSGCGQSQSGSGAFETTTIDIDGSDRTYHLLVPNDYDENHPYPIVFRWHGSGGNGLSGGLGIEFSSKDDALIVAPDGLNSGWSGGNQEKDLALFDGLLDVLSDDYCVDLDAVFSYGFSAGGGMTNLLSCERGDVLRAAASIAGFDRGGECVGTPAIWMLHDEDDNTVDISQGEAARDRHLDSNGCSAQTTQFEDICQRYEGCSEPVIWCQSSGIGHNIQGGFAPELVWDFFSEFL